MQNSRRRAYRFAACNQNCQTAHPPDNRIERDLKLILIVRVTNPIEYHDGIFPSYDVNQKSIFHCRVSACQSRFVYLIAGP